MPTLQSNRGVAHQNEKTCILQAALLRAQQTCGCCQAYLDIWPPWCGAAAKRSGWPRAQRLSRGGLPGLLGCREALQCRGAAWDKTAARVGRWVRPARGAGDEVLAVKLRK